MSGEHISITVSTKLPKIGELLRLKWTILRSAVLGTAIGILPGVGATTAAFIGYSEAVRYSILGPCIFVLAAVGAFGIRNDVMDLWIMLACGLLGYFFKKFKYPIAPMVIGLVLGPLTETSLRRGLNMTDFDLMPFLWRPIAGPILVIAVGSVLWNLYSVFIKKGKASLEEIE